MVGFVLISTAVPLVGSYDANDEGVGEQSAYDRYLSSQRMQREMSERRVTNPLSLSNDNSFSYESGPFPIANDDGSIPGINSVSLVELFNNPPYFIGNGMEVTDAYEYYVVGDAHEMHFGDLNGDDILGWATFYFDMGLSVNGVDDDGDGCVDETSHETPDGIQCDTVPDAVVFFGVGGLPKIDGDLVAYVDWYFGGGLKLFRIGASPRWVGQSIRGFSGFFSNLVGDFVVFHGDEASENVNVNKAIGDKDLEDWFVGIIDARGFPGRPPKKHYCRTTAYHSDGGAYERQDGSIVVPFQLWEPSDEAPGYDNDYNDDGDTFDKVIAYFIVNPRSGKCKKFVNTGVAGDYLDVAENVITAGKVYENVDSRDWNNDGSMYNHLPVWHDVTSTEKMAGGPYFGHTFRTPVPRGPPGQPDSYGFGFTGLFVDRDIGFHLWPMEFGATYELYVGYPNYYEAHYGNIMEEDGKQWTELPGHPLGVRLISAVGGTCIFVWYSEDRLDADVNGDGDKLDGVSAVYCPDPNVPGTGKWESEPASNYPPWFTMGSMFYYCSDGGKNLITIPFIDFEEWTPPVGGDTANYYVARNWHYNKVDPDFQILDAQWVGDPRVKMKGSISGYIDVRNVWPINILCHARIENDLGWEMKSDGCVENTERDGILHHGETARIHFTLYAPDKGKTGIFTLTIELTLQRVTKSVQMDVELYRN